MCAPRVDGDPFFSALLGGEAPEQGLWAIEVEGQAPDGRGVIQSYLRNTPILRTEIRPFVRDARPVVRNLKPASKNLATATPDLTRTFTVLNHLFNMVGFNPNGREGPGVAGRDEGFLFWLAWLDHNGAALFSSSDANGPFRPVSLGAPCSTLKQTGDANPPLGMILAPALSAQAGRGRAWGTTGAQLSEIWFLRRSCVPSPRVTGRGTI